MFDGRSCAGPMLYSSSCQAVNKWSYMNYFDIENGKSSLEVDGNDAPRQPGNNVRNGKRPLEINVEEDESQQRKCTRMLGSCQKGDPAGISFEQKVYKDKDPLDASVNSQMDRDRSTIHEQNKSCQQLSNSRRVEEAEAWSDGLSDEQQQHLAGDLSGGHHSAELQHQYGESSYSSDQKSDEQLLKDQEYAGDLLKLYDQQSAKEQQNHGGDSSNSGPLLPRMDHDSSVTCLSHCSRSDYGTIASLNRSFYELVKSGELYKWRRIYGIIEHWIYFSCALLEWEAFDPIRQRWMHLPRMASNQCFMCSDKESLAVGTELLVFGKELTSHVIYRYSLFTNSWTSGMRMNDPRCLFGSASLGEIAILAGGCDSAGRILSSAELYNSENQTWELLPRMNKPRKMCSGVFMDQKFYVIGGIGGSESKLLTCGEEYNLQTRTWTEIPNMSPGRSSRGTEMPATAEAPPLVAVVNNELYAANYSDMEVKKYDKNRKEWNTIGRLPERAVSMNGWGLAFRACGDRLIVIGGARTSGEGFIELNSWVPSEGPPQWNLLARKRSGNFVYNCAVMGC